MSAIYSDTRVKKIRTTIVYLVTAGYSLEAIVSLLKTEWTGRDAITYGGNSSSMMFHVDIGHERIWEGMIP